MQVFIPWCGADATAQLDALPTRPSTITLAALDEPGKRLVLHGRVVNQETRDPVSNVLIYLYHADANGEYQPTDSAEESTARLSGELATDANGRFSVYTIVPREYDHPGNKHIHLHSVSANCYKPTGGVILFEFDVSDEIRQWAIETGFGTIIKTEVCEGTRIGELVIEMEKQRNRCLG